MIASSTGLANQNSLITMSKKHPGFAAVQASIAKRQGISKDRAGAILASATRKAQGLAKNAKIPKRRK
jgi:hypothetical protein